MVSKETKDKHIFFGGGLQTDVGFYGIWGHIRTEVETVFTSVPAASELAALTVGAFPPADACSVCDGEA